MKSVLIYLLALLSLALIPDLCRAQQRPGGNGPLPGDPGYGSGGGYGSGATGPSGRWAKTWGAIAIGATGGSGASAGKTTKRKAEEAAVQTCSAGGEPDCKPVFSYKNSCVAVATPKKEDAPYKISTASSLVQAEELALKLCNDGGGSACAIAYAGCSAPIFKRLW